MSSILQGCLSWLVMALAITGTILVTRKRRVGFIFWMVSNTALLGRNFFLGEWSQAALWGVYLVLAVYGWFSWKRRKE